MSGKKIGEVKSTATTTALPVEGFNPKFETSIEGNGTFLGVDVTIIATYSSEIHADGTVYGEYPNQVVLLSQEGPVTFRGNGAGPSTDDGGASFRGADLLRTSAPSLAELNGMCLVHEGDVDGNGNGPWHL